MYISIIVLYLSVLKEKKTKNYIGINKYFALILILKENIILLFKIRIKYYFSVHMLLVTNYNVRLKYTYY